jgi:hypothetical protein
MRETKRTPNRLKRWGWGILCLLIFRSNYGQKFINVGFSTNTVVVCNAHGSGFFDYNSDGWDDIYVVHNTSVGPYQNLDNTLLKNLQNGQFSNVTQEVGCAGRRIYSAQGLAAGDYDNDGDMDMCIGMGGYLAKALFYRNNGNQTFSDLDVHIMDEYYTFHARCLAFFDYDNDGLLDLFFLRETFMISSINPLFVLYRNDGRGFFENVTRQAGLYNFVPIGGDAYGFALADVNNDNFLDVYVPRRDATSLFLINNGNGTFSEAAAAVGLPQDSCYTGATFLDYDNDGYWDLFIRRKGRTAMLYRNNGNGTFADASHAAGIDMIVSYENDSVFGGGLSTGDFDNDGYVDLLVITKWGMNILLFHNNGNGTFTEISTSAGLREDYYSYWTAPVADFNHDGYLDIYMAISPGNNPGASIYANDVGANTNKSIQLSLEGVHSNRSAIGARIEGHLNGKIQLRQVQGGDSYKVNSFTVHFGTGQATHMDSIIIYWPSGIKQHLIDVPVNNGMPFLHVVEKDTVQYFGDLFITGVTAHVKSEYTVSQVAMGMTGGMSKNVLTDGNGYYRFFPIKYGIVNLTVTPSKQSDEDVGEGVVTSYDAALILRYLTGLDPLSAMQKVEADADASGSIDALDAAYIARYAVGCKNDARSKVGDWRFVPTSRTYASMTKNYKDQNFQCLVVGDVSENWGNPGGLGKASASAFYPHRIQVSQNSETVEVPVSVEERSGLLSADVWLRYDPSGLDFQDVQLTDLTSGFHLEFNQESKGFLKMALYGVRPVSEGGTIMNVRFRVRNGGQTAIQWEKVAINDQEFRVSETLVWGVSEAGEGGPQTFGLKGNYPNPFNPGTVIQI